MIRVLSIVALIALLPGWAALAESPTISGAEGSSPRARLLRLLHDGQFDPAERLIESEIARAGRNAERSFFRAFVTYWRYLYDPENDAILDKLEGELKSAISIADRELKNSPDEGATRLWRGSSHLILAQVRASQRKVFGAAFEAKRAKKHLEAAVKADSPPVESDFGLGTYLYFADIVPGILKGIRALMFIPGGDREEGLRRLERAAERSSYFAIESHILLATIYADKREGLYDEAMEQRDAALGDYPESVAVLFGAARLELAVAQPYLALRHLEIALARCEALPETAPSVVATLAYYAAQAELWLFRPDRALEHLRPYLEDPSSAPSSDVDRIRRLAFRAATLCGGPPDWYRALPERGQPPTKDADELRRWREAGLTLAAGRDALRLEREGDLAASAHALRALYDVAPQDPTRALLVGRSLLIQGRGEEALPYLRQAMDSDRFPNRWQGAVRLMAGMAADVAGDRAEAISLYQESEERGFHGDNAARWYQKRPFEGVGGEGPPG